VPPGAAAWQRRSTGAAGGGIGHDGPLGGLRVDAMGMSEGTGGVVNELLIQMQSFDTAAARGADRNALTDRINAYLPAHRQLKRRPSAYNNLLLIAATNRADRLDPALLRRAGSTVADLRAAGQGRPARADRPLPRPQAPRPRSSTATSSATRSPGRPSATRR
jgi:cell division protease FtsH